MPLIQLDDVPLHVLERGRGPAVLLIHSFPHDHRVWDAQAEALAERYRVITPDLPGFGQSPKMRNFSIEAVARLMLQLIARLELQRVVVGGISMGGYVSLAVAKQKPQQLAGVILTDTKAAADTTDARQKRSDSIELIRCGGEAHVIGQMLPTQLAPDVAKVRPAAQQRLRSIMETQSADAMIAGLTALRDRPDYTEVLSTLELPVLLVFGDQDQITPATTAQVLAKPLKRSTTCIIPDAGHISTIDQPEKVTSVLREFLDATFPA